MSKLAASQEITSKPHTRSLHTIKRHTNVLVASEKSVNPPFFRYLWLNVQWFALSSQKSLHLCPAQQNEYMNSYGFRNTFWVHDDVRTLWTPMKARVKPIIERGDEQIFSGHLQHFWDDETGGHIWYISNQRRWSQQKRDLNSAKVWVHLILFNVQKVITFIFNLMVNLFTCSH